MAQFLDDPTKMKAFRYETPPVEGPKKIVWLARTDRMFATMQVVTEGGETNLHKHSHVDGFWFVLKGRAKFYSDETTLAAELGPSEGMLVPRGVKYWFESVGAEPLEILQIECADVAVTSMQELASDRTDFSPQRPSMKLSRQVDAKVLT
jgi:mannose-6-phosphate isomerase-like protein (cupin superfamily)